MKLKVMTILGTRPEIIRLCEVIKVFDSYFHHILVHTGQNWDDRLYDVFFSDLELRNPDHYLGVAADNLGQSIGNIISKCYEVLQNEKPDALLVLGDTNSALSAIAAKRLKIPIFHMEAGNRCFDQNVPEEINRKIVDHVSDINLPYTEHSRRYLLSEGFRKEHIYVTGSPMTEVLGKYRESIENSPILESLGLEPGRYILVSAHREENIDIQKNFDSLVETLNAVAERYALPIIYSTHPRTRNRMKELNVSFHPGIKNLEPFGFFDYNKLQKNSFCALSDSGTLSEESAIMRFPAVLIRTSTERPEVLDKGTMVIGGIEKKTVINAIELATGLFADREDVSIPADYQDTCVSVKVAKIVASYVEIINRIVWRK
jgi:UDP-N-acetylglucosamine 2-epimerase (non-hydrolysing)